MRLKFRVGSEAALTVLPGVTFTELLVTDAGEHVSSSLLPSAKAFTV